MGYRGSVLLLALALAACGGGGGESEGTNSRENETRVVDAEGTVYYVPTALYQWVAAAAKPIRSLGVSAADDFADLAAFGEAIGDARVVSLTEDTHGDANAYELMNRQVQYLHQKKGFDVLLMESALFDVEAIWRAATEKNAPVAELAPGRVFFMYSKNDSARKVLHYVDQQKASTRPLILAGYDEPAGGDVSTSELVPALQQFLSGRSSTIVMQPDWADFASMAYQAAALTSGTQDKTTFYRVANQIKQEICTDPALGASPRTTAGWWCLQVDGLVAAAQRQTALATTGSVYSPLTDPRESQMYRNALWVIQKQFPGKKIILWSNAQHGLNNYLAPCWYRTGKPCTVAEEENVEPAAAAAWLKKDLGQELYIVKNTARTGRITDFNGGSPWSLPVFPDPVLASLDQLALGPVFIARPQDSALLPMLERLTTEAGLTMLANGSLLGRQMDAMFVYPQSVPADKQDYAVVPLP
ncbi:hypothetical protein ACTSKR_10305 [Chitinibacteraceae bacterium HSL-7]